MRRYKEGGNKKNNLLSFLLLPLAAAAVSIVLFVQAFHPSWQQHLQSDIVIHQQQANAFWQTGSWRDIAFKEYQPGALLFFLIPSLLASGEENYSMYLNATLFLNGLLLIAHAMLMRRYGPLWSVWILLALLLTMGPIILYRFELIVSLLVLVAWIALTRARYAGAGFTLGLATAIKLYPIALLPIITFGLVRERRWQELLRGAMLFLVGMAVVVVPFLIFGGTIADISDGLAGYRIKPVSLDGMWGSIITLVWKAQRGTTPPIDGAHGIQGIAPLGTILPLGFYDLLWIIPTLSLAWWMAGTSAWRHAASVPVLVLTVFTVSSKVVNPQYLWWFISFVPLLPLMKLKRWQKASLLLTSVLALALTQLVYPLYYSAFLDWFYARSPDARLFIISLLRNGLLVIFIATLLSIYHHDRTRSLAPH